MNLKSLIVGIVFFILAHTTTWFQVNGQFIWNYFKENTFILTLFGIPISYFYIWAAKYTVEGFNNTMWSARFVGFGVGILIYALLVGVFFKEGISLKTFTSLLLAISLILVQIFWK
jgi:membrane protein CcdC involved in cytochrome C biogenesis